MEKNSWDKKNGYYSDNSSFSHTKLNITYVTERVNFVSVIRLTQYQNK